MKHSFKDKKSISDSYIQHLAQWIRENQHTYFKPENQADSWADFITFPTMKTDREHLCMPEEVMLIDRDYKGIHMYCICTVGANRKVTSEIPVIAIEELDRNAWRNGYFLLPNIALQ